MWDCLGIMYEDYLKSRHSIKSAIYNNMLIKFMMSFTKKEEMPSEEKWFSFSKITADNMLGL